jgi:fibronectin type 3 domain-containing protein
VSSTAYVDNTVASAQTFYYVVTALASGGQESGFSGEVAVAIP